MFFTSNKLNIAEFKKRRASHNACPKRNSQIFGRLQHNTMENRMTRWLDN